MASIEVWYSSDFKIEHKVNLEYRFSGDAAGQLAVNPSNVEEAIASELKISADETKLFVTLVKGGRMDPSQISDSLGWEVDRAQRVAASLVNKGMVIEFGKTQFESLHPRFAITNRYRRRCEEDGIQFKKNLRVDNIGIVLEKPYDDARTNNNKKKPTGK